MLREPRAVLTVSVPASIWQLLDKAAEQEKTSKSFLVTQAIRLLIEDSAPSKATLGPVLKSLTQVR